MEINNVTILGSGTSTGIPIPSCKCTVCTSSNKKNKRLRTSILLSTKNNQNVLIDTTTDFRTQALNNKIDNIDSVIITHEHADHIHGIDDLRPFCFGPPEKNIPVYTYARCNKILTEKFKYIFDPPNRPIIGGGIPRLTIKTVKINEVNKIGNDEFFFFLLPHGYTETLCFIHDKMAYLPDCHSISPDILKILKSRNLDLLIIDCLKIRDHDTHLNLERALKYIEQINAKKSGLIHMAHSFDHDKLQKELKSKYSDNVFALYDGLKLTYS